MSAHKHRLPGCDCFRCSRSAKLGCQHRPALLACGAQHSAPNTAVVGNRTTWLLEKLKPNMSRAVLLHFVLRTRFHTHPSHDFTELCCLGCHEIITTVKALHMLSCLELPHGHRLRGLQDVHLGFGRETRRATCQVANTGWQAQHNQPIEQTCAVHALRCHECAIIQSRNQPAFGPQCRSRLKGREGGLFTATTTVANQTDPPQHATDSHFQLHSLPTLTCEICKAVTAAALSVT